MTSISSATWRPPTSERYIVSVDHQAKSSFSTSEAAHAEARRISESFPNVVVTVKDTEQSSTTALDPLVEVKETDM
jgi:hypothetical protein